MICSNCTSRTNISQDRNATPGPETPDRKGTQTTAGASNGPDTSTPSAEKIASGGEFESKDLKSYFAGLVKPRKKPGDSATNSPAR